MKKPKKLVVGNWKTNPMTLAEARALVNGVKRTMKTIKKTQAVFCPPFVYLSSLSGAVSANTFLGAQNAFPEPFGSYTGEVSFAQLPQFGVTHVIIGHSERRVRGETDEMINKKVKAVTSEGMTAIVCVGESTRDTQGDYFSFIRTQLMAALREVNKKAVTNIVVAYEPVWAIGAATAMTPQDLHEMSIYIKKVLREVFGVLADDIAILYGGAVTAENAADIVRDGFVQGLLVGRESLKVPNFSDIIRAVESL